MRPAREGVVVPHTSGYRKGRNIRVRAASFDHLVGGSEQRLRYGQPKCLGRLQIDHQLILGWDLYPQVGWLLAFEDAIDIASRPARKSCLLGCANFSQSVID